MKYANATPSLQAENVRAKAAMSVAFEQHRLKPGDAGFVYDKQIEFLPASGASEWDEEGDED